MAAVSLDDVSILVDNKAANKRDRRIKGAVKLDWSQAQWNPLHALMHSCASRMREYGGNENTHRNHCGYIRLVYTRILLLLSPSILSLSISLYISLCVSQRIGTRACSLRPGITACRINNPSFTCCLCPKPCPSFEKNDRDTCLGGKMDASRTIGSRQIKGNIESWWFWYLFYILFEIAWRIYGFIDSTLCWKLG